MLIENKCPLCNHRLYRRKKGLCCKNWKCDLYHKNKTGWIYVNEYDDMTFTAERLSLPIDELKWLYTKSRVRLRDHNKCRICGSDVFLHVHHILSVEQFPELEFDEENCITLCEICHRRVHKKREDKDE